MSLLRKTASLTALAIAGIASASNAADYNITVTNLTHSQYFTPLLATAHDPGVRLFHAGEPASSQLQAIAEGGNIAPAMEILQSVGATSTGGEGLLAPGASVTLSLADVPSANSVLSIAGMLLPTNDGFIGVDSAALPRGGHSVTLYANGYDAGTEANDEVIGGGAPGVAGFPAPPPVVASGTGTNASGIEASIEGYVHVHRGVLGDLDPTGGHSDINAAVHRFQNPVARVTITRTGEEQASGFGVDNLTGEVYSSTALELFWDPTLRAGGRVSAYRVARDGQPLATLDGLSFFDQSLTPGTSYEYTVTPISRQGDSGTPSSIQLTTNTQ